jgi:hypothetical protein
MFEVLLTCLKICSGDQNLPLKKDNHPAGAATSRDPITGPTTVANAQSFVILEERNAKPKLPVLSRCG